MLMTKNLSESANEGSLFPAESKDDQEHMNDLIHSLRLRWMAGYLLYVDDRFERAHQAYLSLEEEISRTMEEANGFDSLSDLEKTKLFAEHLAKKVEDFLSCVSQDDDQAEMDLDQKISEIAKLFTKK